MQTGFLPQSDMIRQRQDWNKLIYVPRDAILRHESVAEPGFPTGGGRHTIILVDFPPKLHENEKNWTQGRRVHPEGL